MYFDTRHICDAQAGSSLDVFDPRSRILCAFFLSAVLASVQSFSGLFVGSLIPVSLLFIDALSADGLSGLKRLLKTLVHVNAITVFVWILLPLTYPGERIWGVFSIEGLVLALKVTWKLNLISVVLIQMVVKLGMGRIDNVLGDFHIPEKMRVLLLLTLRYSLLLAERVATMTRSIFLRAPDLRGARMCRTFACMLGTTLIHSADRAERSLFAMRCRGGMAGFSQCCPARWRAHDTFLCAFFALNSVLTVAAPFFL